MVNRLPYEVLSTVGIFLSQENQKNCALVCKSWRRPFQTLVFQKAVFSKPEQLAGFLEQDASFKQLAKGLHFDIPLTDQQFNSIAEQCPKVDTLTLFINLLNNLSIPKTVSVIKKHWLKHLVKIRMDELILPKVLPLISDQVQDVTGGFSAFFDKKKKLIPMPQLKELDIEQEEGASNDIIAMLDPMRLAYPNLKKLTLRHFDIGRKCERSEYTPFPLVRSLHFINCDNSFEHLHHTFVDLHELSHLRMRLSSYKNQTFHKNLVSEYPNLRQLAVSYSYLGIMNFSLFEELRALKHFYMEGSTETKVVTDRELLDLRTLMTSMPRLQDLRIVGLFHVNVGEALEHYLCGTVGFCRNDVETDSDDSDNGNMYYGRHYSYTNSDSDRDSDDTYSNRANERNIDKVRFSNMLHPVHREVFGNGENLCKDSRPLLRVKKGRPKTCHDLWSPVNQWNISRTLLSLQTYPDPQTPIYRFMLKLELDWVTLRTPSYEWIKKCLPSLQEFYVHHSEPYPFCEIPLGSNVHTFEIDFDARYDDGTFLPLANLMLTKENGSVRNRRFLHNEETDRYELDSSVELEKYSHALNSVDLNFFSSLSRLLICQNNMSDQLETIKMS